MIGMLVRAIFMVAAFGFGVRLLGQAGAQRRAWLRRERLLSEAEGWWNAVHGGPFDQERPPVPQQLQPYLTPNGPRSELHEPSPAQAQFVWGLLLCVIGLMLLITIVAQLAGGLF